MGKTTAASGTPAVADDIFRFILREDGYSGAITLAAAVLAGLAVSHFLVLIGLLAQDARAGQIDAADFGRFLVSLALVAGAQYAAMQRAIGTTERCLFNVLTRLAARLRATTLETLEREGTETLYGTISQDGTTLSNATLLAATILQNAAVFAGCAVYLLVTVPDLFLVLSIFVGVWYGLHRAIRRDALAQQVEAARSEQRFNAAVQEITGGFRELRLDPRKMQDVLNRVARPAAEAARRDRILAAASFVRQLRVQGATWLLALVCLAFVLPRLGLEAEVVVAFFVVAYLWQPTAEAVTLLPNLARAGTAIARLRGLEGRLAPELDRLFLTVDRPIACKWLTLRGVRYAYPPPPGGERGFAVGPVDLDVRVGGAGNGEVLFLTGGNGSGKSTLIKVLTGLYPLHDGVRLVNGREVALEEYRSLFSYIPTDFHLFDRLYGIPPERHGEGAAFLQRLGLGRVVGIADGRFTTTELSAGQRKRLGLAVALMERRPIVVLDEWAADQDPQYRKLFYEELLEVFRAQGRTVIAASHDDQYFHVADRVIRMADGMIVNGEHADHR